MSVDVRIWARSRIRTNKYGSEGPKTYGFGSRTLVISINCFIALLTLFTQKLINTSTYGTVGT